MQCSELNPDAHLLLMWSYGTVLLTLIRSPPQAAAEPKYLRSENTTDNTNGTELEIRARASTGSTPQICVSGFQRVRATPLV
jgi:hypothetical protein